jgi:hypothetical protein|tara:strand:+ start:838 stop:1815 length:978 start_codon:yes stop_codon:yes gene_type:complete
MAYIQPDKTNYGAGEMSYGNFMVPTSNSNTGGALHSFNMIGSITEMPTIADRDIIPVNIYSSTNTGFTDNLDGISSGRRRIGMLVYVLETQKHYQLLPSGYFGNNGDGTLAQFNALPEWDRARLLHPEQGIDGFGSGIFDDQSSFQPGQGLVYTEVPITGVAADCWVEIDLLNSESGGPTKYLAYVTFTVAEEVESITMVDPAGDKTFSVKNVTTGTSAGGNGEKFAEFTFGDETSAPGSITILASNMITSEYKITSLNGGGDDKQYIVANATMTQTPGTDKFTSDIFNTFSNATIKLDLTKSNIDYVRRGFPTKEAHAYIIFTF